MHVMGIKKEIVDEHPWVPLNLYNAFNEAKRLGMRRMENPRIAPVAWYREAWEEQEEILGSDPWEYGITEKNAKQLDMLVGFSHEQGLISRRIPLDELFLKVDQGHKRGHVFRV
jgi:4,5-dihydroxyphthalate decarboxylase